MPSVISGFLIFLKLAMAVNDGLHTMLSNVYSVLESAMLNDNRNEKYRQIHETDAANDLQRSQSRILEAFNRRRANLQIGDEETNLLIANLPPFQEKLIVDEDETKNESAVKFELIDDEICCGEVNEETRSMVKDMSSERFELEAVANGSQNVTEDERIETDEFSKRPNLDERPVTDYPQCFIKNKAEKVNQVLKLFEPNAVENGSWNIERYSESSSWSSPNSSESGIACSYPELEGSEKFYSEEEPLMADKALTTGFEIRSSSYPALESDYLLILQKKIQSTRQALSRALTKEKTKTPYALMDSDSTDSDKTEVSKERKQILRKAEKLYESFIHDFYHSDKLASSNQRNIQENGSDCDKFSNLGKNVLKGSASSACLQHDRDSQRKCNSVPNFANDNYDTDQTDSDSSNFGYSSNTNLVSKSFLKSKPFIKQNVLYNPNKDKWIEMGNMNCLQKLSYKNLVTKESGISKVNNKNKWNEIKHMKSSASQKEKQTFSNFVFEESSKPKASDDTELNFKSIGCIEESKEFNSGWRVGSSDSSQDFQISPICNLSCNSSSSDESDASDELEMVSSVRVDALEKNLKNVVVTKVLEYQTKEKNKLLSNPKECLQEMDDIVVDGRTVLEQVTINDLNIKQKVSVNKVMKDLENYPLGELKTEENQIEYLNRLTDNYKQRSKQDNFQRENEIYITLSEKAKDMLDAITNELDSLTENAGMCLDELSSIDKDLKTKFRDTKSEEQWLFGSRSHETSAPDQDLDAFGLTTFTPNFPVKDKADYRNESFADLSKSFECGNKISTPTKNNCMDDVWVSINLSSGSRKDINDSFKNANPCICLKNLKVSSSVDEIKQPLSENKDISLAAKDWVTLAAEMTKNYEQAISFLNMIDESENVSVKEFSDLVLSPVMENIGKVDEDSLKKHCEAIEFEKSEFIEQDHCTAELGDNSSNANVTMNNHVQERDLNSKDNDRDSTCHVNCERT